MSHSNRPFDLIWSRLGQAFDEFIEKSRFGIVTTGHDVHSPCRGLGRIVESGHPHLEACGFPDDFIEELLLLLGRRRVAWMHVIEHVSEVASAGMSQCLIEAKYVELSSGAQALWLARA